jgi:hypothetical protein
MLTSVTVKSPTVQSLQLKGFVGEVPTPDGQLYCRHLFFAGRGFWKLKRNDSWSSEIGQRRNQRATGFRLSNL